jgi:carboxypeptidase C (cathepsin A)
MRRGAHVHFTKPNQVPAGYVTTYATNGPANFTFITVKDAGHLVPGYQPARARALLEKFIAGKPF